MTTVPYIDLPLCAMHEVPTIMAQVPSYPIACANWKDFPYTPIVQVKIAHTPSHLLLHYHVQEKNIRAKCTQPNQEVWKDSCVEFFISLDNRKTYYSFEFNCIGTPLLRYNTAPNVGSLATTAVMDKMIISSVMDRNFADAKSRDVVWQLTAAIPFTCFFAHRVVSLSGKVVHANFYKCGDELEEPHFLSMFPISTPKPNFHCPNFFGELAFATSNHLNL